MRDDYRRWSGDCLPSQRPRDPAVFFLFHLTEHDFQCLFSMYCACFLHRFIFFIRVFANLLSTKTSPRLQKQNVRFRTHDHCHTNMFLVLTRMFPNHLNFQPYLIQSSFVKIQIQTYLKHIFPDGHRCFDEILANLDHKRAPPINIARTLG